MDTREARALARRSLRWNVWPIVILQVGAFLLLRFVGTAAGVVAFAGIGVLLAATAFRLISRWTHALSTVDAVEFEAAPDALVIVDSNGIVERPWQTLRARVENDQVIFLHFEGVTAPVVVPLDRADDAFLNDIRSRSVTPAAVEAVDTGRVRLLLLGIALALVLVFLVSDDGCDIRIPDGEIAVLGGGSSSARICT